MWPVSSNFKASIPAGFQVATDVSVKVGSAVSALAFSSGSYTVQDGNVRRTASLVIAENDALSVLDIYNLLSTDGAIITVTTGIDWGGGVREMVPVIVGRPSRVSRRDGDGVVSVDVADFGYDLAAQSLFPAVVQSASMTRRAAVKALVSAAFPSATITDTATDTGTLGSEQTWSGSRWDAINSLCTDGGMELFFLPDGNVALRDIPVLATPVYGFVDRDGGSLSTVDRERPLDKLYNTVTISQAATDGSQTWTNAGNTVTLVSVSINDTSNPRNPSKIGVRILALSSSTATTYAAAVAIATRKLDAVQGSTETTSLTSFGMSALELGDTVTVQKAASGDDPALTLTHMIDGYTFDLATSAQTIQTRNRTDE